jgi:hypothetical protein
MAIDLRTGIDHPPRREDAGTETAFAECLKDRGYEHKRMKNGRGFKGITLKANNGPSMEGVGG